MSKGFFMSDTQFTNSGGLRTRGYESAEEMCEDFIARWNAVVGKYHQGVLLNDLYSPRFGESKS
jgi:calcineurin-like phosphoesterase family protein